MLARRTATLLCLCTFLSCTSHNQEQSDSHLIARRGDEIVVCGQFVHIGAPVLLWMDPSGFDAYHATPTGQAGAAGYVAPRRYNPRFKQEELQATHGGVPPSLLAAKVDQFVLHYDVTGTSHRCFQVLCERGLSVHFMLDVDGTIYQTLDLQERAWHATTSNDRSIGIEIANIGAYDAGQKKTPLADWYRKDPQGHTRLIIPAAFGAGKFIHTPNFAGHPIRDEAVIGSVQGRSLRMYDLTPQQYDSLIKLTAALCTTFPKIRCDYPRGSDGQVITRRLPDAELAAYQGVLGHYHVQSDKTDPGPAMQWERVIGRARLLMANLGRVGPT